MIGSLEIQGKYSFVDPKDEEADKEDYINNSRNDRAAVLNVYQSKSTVHSTRLSSHGNFESSLKGNQRDEKLYQSLVQGEVKARKVIKKQS